MAAVIISLICILLFSPGYLVSWEVSKSLHRLEYLRVLELEPLGFRLKVTYRRLPNFPTSICIARPSFKFQRFNMSFIQELTEGKIVRQATLSAYYRTKARVSLCSKDFAGQHLAERISRYILIVATVSIA